MGEQRGGRSGVAALALGSVFTGYDVSAGDRESAPIPNPQNRVRNSCAKRGLVLIVAGADRGIGGRGDFVHRRRQRLPRHVRLHATQRFDIARDAAIEAFGDALAVAGAREQARVMSIA